MYGIFTNIWVFFRANVGKDSIHGASGKEKYFLQKNAVVKNVSPRDRVMSPFGRVMSPFGRAMSPLLEF